MVDVKSSATYLRLFLCFWTCDWKKSTRVFNDLVWTYLVWNITQERKTAFDRFKKAVRQVFLNKLRRTAEYAHIKIETLSKLLRYHIINEWKRFFAACSAFRGASLSSFGIFDLGRSRKKAFCTFDYWELSKFFFLRVSRNSLCFIYLLPMWLVNGKFDANFFPMRNCLDLHYRDRYLSRLCILVKPSELVWSF